MLKFLPVGFLGLIVGGLIAANSSTILTHLNWGASYLVHDFYRRFITPGRQRKALRHGRPGRDGRLFFCRRRDGLRPRHGQGQLRHHPPGRGRHGPALPGPLVLVAGQRLVRSRGHGLFFSGLRGPARPAEVGGRRPHPLCLDDHRRRDDDLLGDDRLPGPPTDRKTLLDFYKKVRPVRAGLEGRPGRSRDHRGRGREPAKAFLWPWSAGCPASP